MTAQLAKLLLILILAIAWPQASSAEDARTSYSVDTRWYQVFGKIEDTGLTERLVRQDKDTSTTAWIASAHQKIAGVQLIMAGNTLTWDGQPQPDSKNVIFVDAPRISLWEGDQASISSANDSPQFMERHEGELFKLITLPEDARPLVSLGVQINKPQDEAAALRQMHWLFQYTWVAEREDIEGVDLEIGKPVIRKVSDNGIARILLGRWYCYQTQVDPDVWMLLFIRVSSPGQEGTSSPGKNKVVETVAPAEDISVKSIEVGGSVRVRAGKKWAD